MSERGKRAEKIVCVAVILFIIALYLIIGYQQSKKAKAVSKQYNDYYTNIEQMLKQDGIE